MHLTPTNLLSAYSRAAVILWFKREQLCFTLFYGQGQFACLQGKAISDEDLTQLHNLASPWQSDIVQSLRRIRTRLKTGPSPAPNAVTEDLRDKVKAAELAAEKIQIEMMQAWVSQLTDVDMVKGLRTLPTIINTITRIVATSSKTEITQIQHDHIRVIAAAACQIEDLKTEIIQS